LRLTCVALVVAVACALGVGSAAAPPPIVIELFTSEGCSSCPPADDLLRTLAETLPNVIALGEHVDYWDQLGWKDRFSSAALTNRQHVYGARFGIESIYTPQMIVDGRAEVVGSDAKRVRAAIERAAAMPHADVRIVLDRDPERVALHDVPLHDVARPFQGREHVTVTVANLPPLSRGDRADIVIAVTEGGLRSDVRRGENHGKVLSHAAVVRHLAPIGEASAGGSSAHAELSLDPAWRREQLKIVAFVQERRGRTVLGAASTSVPR